MSVLYNSIYTIGTKLPVKGTEVLGNALGTAMWFLLPKRKKLAVESIQKHLRVSHEEAIAIGKSSFRHNCRSFLEIFLVPTFDSTSIEKYVIEDPSGAFKQISETDYPIVATTAHMGAWEVLAALLGEKGKPEHRAQPLIVVRSNKNPHINDLIFKLRGGRGAQILGHRNAVFSVLRSLKRKAVAAFLVDHNTKKKEAIFMDFLGEPAAINSGPAFLALKAKAAVMPVFLVRNKQGGYTYIIEPLLQTDTLTGTREEKIQQITAFYTEAVERIIQKYPDQWFWMHNRWKTKPDASDVVIPKHPKKSS
ncbi:MAG: lysophospholipid acyltransferase family protein [Desulfovibrionales bacterium]|nr:lysophospholipid acyltransferase family protein [Desulfovibrionales bacterium]